MNLSELEALAKRDDRQGYVYATRVPAETILQMIELIRRLGHALQEAEEAMADHGTAYLNHEDEYSTGVGYVRNALNALKEFDHD